jgi:RNA polymerase sigma-70 factor, ECF subfamily
MTTSCTTSTNKHSDEALVAATKRGDAQAFEELVLRHKHRVLVTAQRITNNWEDAEDVAQESFHKAFLHLGTFEERARFCTWLTRIAMNEAFMLRRRRRGVFQVLPEDPDAGAMTGSEAFVDQSPDPEESCLQRERAQLLTAAINRLRPKVRSTVLLRDIEERSVEETAQILDISVGAVKARLFQGRRRLRRAVNAEVVWGASASSSDAADCSWFAAPAVSRDGDGSGVVSRF